METPVSNTGINAVRLRCKGETMLEILSNMEDDLRGNRRTLSPIEQKFITSVTQGFMFADLGLRNSMNKQLDRTTELQWTIGLAQAFAELNLPKGTLAQILVKLGLPNRAEEIMEPTALAV